MGCFSSKTSTDPLFPPDVSAHGCLTARDSSIHSRNNFGLDSSYHSGKASGGGASNFQTLMDLYSDLLCEEASSQDGSSDQEALLSMATHVKGELIRYLPGCTKYGIFT